MKPRVFDVSRFDLARFLTPMCDEVGFDMSNFELVLTINGAGTDIEPSYSKHAG